jgi:hypothetical protein
MYSSRCIMMGPLQEKIDLQGGPYFCNDLARSMSHKSDDLYDPFSSRTIPNGTLYGSMIWAERKRWGGLMGVLGGPGRQEQDYSELSIGGQRVRFKVMHQNLLATVKHKPYSTTLPSRFTSTRLRLSRTCHVLYFRAHLLKPPSIMRSD